MGLRKRGRRRCGRDGSSHRGEREVGGVSEGLDDEVEDEKVKEE